MANAETDGPHGQHELHESFGPRPQERPAAPVPKAVAGRLSLYLREAERLAQSGVETVNSRQIGLRLGVTDAQVRKDLAYFGAFGRPGVGYRTTELAQALGRVLGADHQWPAAMIGAGNLGRALLGYRGFERRGFRIAAVFDQDPQKIGRELEGHIVEPIDELETTAERLGIMLGVIVVPAEAAQTVANRLVAAGVRGILNFAPVTLSVPDGISVLSVDLAVQLEQLAFSVLHAADRPPSAALPTADLLDPQTGGAASEVPH